MNKQIAQLKLEDMQDVIGGVEAMAMSAYASPKASPYASIYPQPVYKQPVAPAPTFVIP